ncbi:hypothetical protein AYI69_g389 [Smittium culicis]|uniref:Cyclin-D1-binding protein 1-like N-terminal domain-containing protein n=1 Tax=Smittium culicis TaxID=133412 RepID=A0A1R1YTA4_9FUNG|nr:hypothetical protein AYI69_g389 [Smittium culicis]
MSAQDTRLETFFRKIHSKINFLKDQIIPFKGNENNSYAVSPQDFHNRLATFSLQLNKEVTKFVLAGKPPLSKNEIIEIAPLIYQKALEISNLIGIVPKSFGSTFILLLVDQVVDTFENVNQVIEVFFDAESLSPSEYTKKLMTTSKSMKSCEALSNFVSDNREAVEKLWKLQVMGFLDDGIDEVSLAIHDLENESQLNSVIASGNGVNDLSESFQNMNLSTSEAKIKLYKEFLAILISSNLMIYKIQKSILQKNTLTSEEKTVWYDRLLELGKKIPEISDDLVFISLYSEPGTPWQQLSISKARELSILSISIIELATSFGDHSTSISIDKIKTTFLKFVNRSDPNSSPR